MQKQIIHNDIRISFLGKGVIRLERACAGAFFDGDTFFIPNRNAVSGEPPAFILEDDVLCFGEYELYLPEAGLKGLRLEKNGRPVYRYRPLKNSGELPPPSKTPQVFALADTPRILLPEGGYSANRRGEYRIFPRVEDVYLLFAEGDGKKLRELYVELTGRCELVRKATLGSWNSKYYPYTEQEAREVILEYERRNIPLDNLVIDTDWRLAENGMGYRVNEKLFPDLPAFFRFAHSHGVEVMFNDHPEPVRGANVFASREIAYREKSLKGLLQMGLDTWWYDRNWITHLVSPTKSVQWETFGLYLFHDVTERFYAARDGRIHRRPVVMGNVVDISNGVYRGISDSASHRYSIQWTGDIDSCAHALAQETEDLVRCADNCIPYMNSDCGGHTGNPDKAQFLRWMQYGALSPVLRPHCTNTVYKTREPWQYDEETVSMARDLVCMRYRLLPYLYSYAYEGYRTGVGMVRSLSLENPFDKRAAKVRDEYLLGESLLVAPVCGTAPVLLGEKEYAAPVEVEFFAGIACEGAPIARETWKKICMDLRHEPPFAGGPVYDFSARLRTKIKVERTKRLYVRNDDGATVYLDGKCVLKDDRMHAATLTLLGEIEGGREYEIRIEYFQGKGEAFLGLYTAEPEEEDIRSVYLPEGKWMDVFDGAVYRGGRTVKKRYPLPRMPLFVRSGTVIPLAPHAQTTALQSKSALTLDFYPDRDRVFCGSLYEDDGETTAYREGVFRTSAYSARFLNEENAYLLRLERAEGSFEGITRRDITLKFHGKGEKSVVCVRVNGAAAPFETHKKARCFPFTAEGGAPDGNTVTVRLSADVAEDVEVKFYLGSA